MNHSQAHFDENGFFVIGIWEQFNNPDFKPIEFNGFKKQAGLMALFGQTAKAWRDANVHGLSAIV